MKGLCLALVLLPLALAVPSKRLFLDGASLFSSDELHNLVNQIVAAVGSDATEQQCETQCMAILNNALLDTACPFVCNSFQTLVNSVPHDTVASGPSKRFLFDNLLDSAQVNTILQQIYDSLGSDATEQQCETQCMAILNNALLDTACPFVCNSFQAFVNQLHGGAGGAGAVQKRFLEGILDTATMSNLVQQLVAQAGSDETEQQCETQCMAILNNALLDTACPFVCSSLQQLAQHFGHALPTAGPVQKRFVLDSLGINQLEQLFSTADLAHYVNQIVAIAGADETEQQCETACLEVMTTHLLDTACPLICNSFQTLVNMFHLQEGTAAPVQAKRFLLDSFGLDMSKLLGMFSTAELSKYVNQIVDIAGADETEQQCETACLEVMHSDLLDTACPLICNSFQALVQKFHIDAPAGSSAPAAPVQKRFILDSFDLSSILSALSSFDLDKIVNEIGAEIGSDATEYQCEEACKTTELPDALCPMLCSSFQQIAQQVHITEANGAQ